jgi:hypothetical protein
MSTRLALDDLRRALQARDPELVNLVVQLAEQPDERRQPVRQGARTFQQFLQTVRGRQFRRKPDDEQMHYRQEQMKLLEAPDAEVPLTDRLRSHEIVYALWADDGPFARACLLEVIARVKLTYGPWRALKRIFKEAEAKGDTEVFGALAARFDSALAGGRGFDVSRETLGYLVRRAWRFLRRTAVSLPVAYADTCVDVLAQYPNDTQWLRTWVANHILYHGTKSFNRFSFSLHRQPDSLLKYRAFADLWKRSPRPLFTLLERAKAEQVWAFAVEALKGDFRAVLREVEPAWVARLVRVGGKAVDEFVVWVLQNVPRFEQSAFRTLGLHETVLKLFDSPGSWDARAYAAEYARTHARDLPVSELVRLANNESEPVRKLAADLLLSRDARKDVGLEAWGQLLETRHGHELAANALRMNFGARELTPEWFADRLFSANNQAFNFAKTLLPQVHPSQKLGADYFRGLIERITEADSQPARNVAGFALAELARFDLNELPAEFLQRLLLNPLTSPQVRGWIDEGRLKVAAIPVGFVKALAYHPDWEADPWVAALKQTGPPWARLLDFDESLADTMLGWLKDVRKYPPSAVGFDWLLKLVVRSEPRYQEFATELMIKAFTPAEFAPKQPAAAAKAPAVKAAVDLNKASFLFTGKMATMKREVAEAKVKESGGAVAGSVTNKLYYLVIGDEGSPLYGAGAKGSKQLKAEELNAAGANIKIISETAFLRMLAGDVAETSADATLAGSERLWQMATAPGPVEAPLARFAVLYLRRHHPDIALAETDRPVDPGAEIPPSFLTFERVQPLFSESRQPLRALALELANWEFARWSPPATDLLRLSESAFPEVRQFVAKALLAEDTPETRRYRINPDVLSPAAVYSFCESPDPATRALGMELIRRSPRLQLPEELFRLTESPDRQVRAFVIRSLWSLYRSRGTTADWKPPALPQKTVGAGARKASAQAAENRGPGVPHKPDQRPASDMGLSEFLRRVLFEIPPGRPEKSPGGSEGLTVRLKPLPARKAKLSLVEVLRDLALEDGAFARGILPLLNEFMGSRGESEKAACLVAVTRIGKRHAEPDGAGAGTTV